MASIYQHKVDNIIFFQQNSKNKEQRLRIFNSINIFIDEMDKFKEKDITKKKTFANDN